MTCSGQPGWITEAEAWLAQANSQKRLAVFNLPLRSADSEANTLLKPRPAHEPPRTSAAGLGAWFPFMQQRSTITSQLINAAVGCRGVKVCLFAFLDNKLISKKDLKVYF